jgi:N-acyl-D-glutamate deacylase
LTCFRLAAERGVPVYTHARSFGSSEPGSDIESVSEVIGASAITGASLHIVQLTRRNVVGIRAYQGCVI